MWWRRNPKTIELTPEDWQQADEDLARDPREIFREGIARRHAQQRVAREQRERRQRWVNRISLCLLGRRG